MSLPVIPIDRLAFAFEPRRWPFAEARRAEIDAHFAARRAQRPQIWNGRVVLASHYRIADRSLAGACFETDFASFLAWRDWGFPDADAVNVFAMGALRSRDGAFLLGVMGPHTANAGRIYFPAGTPEPDDVADGALDLAGNVAREVAEETGLDRGRLRRRAGLARDSGRRAPRADEGARRRRAGARSAASGCARTSPASSIPSSPTSASCAGRRISIR